ncbi:MAG: phosphoribosyltransferase family protein [Candidatus Gracilibacteria bacterium]|nr:phosphoribosyltransferase family protein [Candidatus Gracilibacteria bacterium]
MGFLNHPTVLLVLRELLGYIPKGKVILEKIPPTVSDVTEWYHTSGIHPRVSQIWVICNYQAISPLLKQWKYTTNPEVQTFLLSTFRDGLCELPELSKKSYILPIPLGIDRWMERGFNQSVVLAKVAKKTFGVGYFPWCFRFWSGKHQSTLTKDERQKRMLNFWIPPWIRVPQHIVLIDDVISTGSTLHSCAEYLIKRGCKRITVIALARSS